MTTIDFSTQGTFNTSVFSASGVTITGSNSLVFVNLNGLGVLGGIDVAVDTNEWVDFSFNGILAGDVDLNIFTFTNSDLDAFPGEYQVEAFGVNGASLGTITVNTSVIGRNSISNLFSNQLISRFRYLPNGDLFRIKGLSFQPGVAITALDDIAVESPTDGAVFRIRRFGGTGSLTVNLTLNSSGNASFEDFTLSGGNVVVTGNSATVTIPDGSDFIDLTITPNDDALAEDEETIRLDLATGSNYAIDGAQSAAIATILASDFSGFSIIQTNGSTTVTEGGATDQLSIVLNAQPNRNAALLINTSSQVSISTSLIAFTPATWNIPQTVTVRAINDLVFEPAQAFQSNLISFTPISADSRFDTSLISPIAVVVSDNDAPARTLIGTSTVDQLFGSTQSELMRGLAGNDFLSGQAGNDRLAGGGSNDTLQGETGADLLEGGAGNDFLNGGSGNDVLVGGAGADRFFFAGVTEGIDTVRDFVITEDLIRVSSAFGGGLVLGGLPASAFVLGERAADTGDRFLYHPTTGALRFDVDGTGSTAAVQIASFSNAAPLTFSNFVVV